MSRDRKKELGITVIESPRSRRRDPSSRKRRQNSRETARHVPRATYRLQFNRQFTLADAAGITSYLRELGISDCYASPLFQPAPESSHGYDVCSFGRLNPNLGSERDFDAFVAALHASGLALMLDVVPNHMSASPANPWWRDVLEKGRASPYSRFFDIDWKPPDTALRGKVLLPVLEHDYATTLENGKLTLEFQHGQFSIAYYESRFPVNPKTLPADAAINPARTLDEYRSARRLDVLIQRQHYVFAQWKDAAKKINYRRFFNVAGLVSLRMELPEVFAATHALLGEWIKAQNVSALRVDHPDGLWNPKQYFGRLRAAAAKASGKSARIYVVVEKILSGNEELPSDWPADGTTGYDFLNRVNGLFINSANERAITELYREFSGCETNFRTIRHDCKKRVLETSLAADVSALTHRVCELVENSPAWELSFEKLNEVLVEVIAAFPVYRTYITDASHRPSPEDCVSIEQAFVGARERNPSLDAAALQSVRQLHLLEPPVWLEPDKASLARRFVMRFQQITGPAMAKGLEDTAFYRFNRFISLNEVGGDPGRFGVSGEEFHESNARIAAHWPHTLLATSTHDTKRGEDVRARLNVLSEMPDEWSDAVLHWRKLNACKKSLVDGQFAPSANDEYMLYQSLVGAWPFETNQADGLCSFRERVTAFMLKAVREAKVNTSWTEPNEDYEAAVHQFIDQILVDTGNNEFLVELREFSKQLAFFGALNSLSQTLLKITSPGVPDFYQGTELWDLSFVDPDNRRPVDYELRKRLLADLKSRSTQYKDDLKRLGSELLADIPSGRIKMFVMWCALGLRRCFADLFQDGEYIPLHASGSRREHVCAFARVHQDEVILTIVPRLIYGLTDVRQELPIGREIWSDTILELPRSLHGHSFRNAFSGEIVQVADPERSRKLELGRVLESFPLALLESVTR